jgi:hypothetical protein
MGANHITLTAGFECGCPAATWVALWQPDDLLREGSALHHYRIADVSQGKSSFFSLPSSPAVEAACADLVTIPSVASWLPPVWHPPGAIERQRPGPRGPAIVVPSPAAANS